LAADAGGAVPGFEIEGTLGRGGMGVVYRAKQTGLNRVVALKMLIAGQYADPSLRARFLLEAESVAALEHPGIVKVFAFGESGGHPYLAMEFVPGGTLAGRIKKNGPLLAKDATQLVAKLSAAVAHAHSRGVVHRDIKPLNVLLTTDGEPRLTDFGLAKVGRADHNLSVTGQVLGTPAYMAPEQAAGKVREVGTAADVYALGAVLYDVLTGRPPFVGDSVAVTLQKVMTEEPQRPRKLNASIPRDLETICLKCLEKDVPRRYPTAQALADDLLRYTRNEPISVRPTGALERGYKWVKRNKVVAGAIAAVSLALLGGAGVSLGFGLYANEKAEQATAAAGREEEEKNKAIAARNEVQQKSNELKRTLAEALLGPITAKNRDKRMTPYEVDALWRIAELRSDDVARMFLVEGSRTPPTCEQLECRAEHALHAAIGLDLTRRDEADRLLLSRLREAGAQGNKAVSPALIIARSEFCPPETAGAAARVLADRLRGGWAPKELQTEADPLRAPLVVGRLPQDEVPDIRFELAAGVIAAAGRMEPAEAAAVCAEVGRILADALAVATDTIPRRRLAALLAAAAARMEPAEAAKVCARAVEPLVDALARGHSHDHELAADLTTVIVWMDPAEAAGDLTAAITGAPAKRMRVGRSYRFPEVLAAVAARMEPGAAADACNRVARALADRISESRDPYPRGQFAQGVIAVAARMGPAEARAGVARTLADELSKEMGAGARLDLARALAAVAARMEPAAAADLCAPVARTLADEISKNAYLHRDLVACLVTVAALMEPIEAADVCAPVARTLADALAKRTDASERRDLVQALAAVAVRLESGAAANVCAPVARALADALTKRTDAPNREDLAAGLAAVAARMDPGAAADLCAPVARALTDALTKETSAPDRGGLAASLAAVAARLEPGAAAAACAHAARVYADMLLNNPNPYHRRQFARELAALSVRAGLAGAGILTDALSKTDADVRGSLAEGLAAVALGFSTDARSRAQSATLLATGAFATPHNVLPSLPLLHPHFHPQPRPLPPQELVELLKHPFCVGEARRAVLDALEFTYKRPFKDQWEFVEYVQRNNIRDHTTGKPLDLLTPPKRPESKP
jgi:tRNA A-37 threonylcarbamoyl transferase component Bud32